MMIGDMD